MAKKSKEFSVLLHQQRRAKKRQETMSTLAQRVEENLQGKVEDIIIDPKGEVKMSEVLQAFIEPYVDTARSREQRLKLLMMAVVAWNLAIIPKAQKRRDMEEMIEQICKKDRQAQRDIRETLEELIERKQTFFADNYRYILDFELTESPNAFHLAVVSSLFPADSNSST
jgi:preprotein translocase subunit YajC